MHSTATSDVVFDKTDIQHTPLSIQDKPYLIREVATTTNVPCTKTAKQLAISISILNMITYNEESILRQKKKKKAKYEKGELVLIDRPLYGCSDLHNFHSW
jgi:hypothetical protein